MTSQFELIKVQVLSCLADAAVPFVQVMVHNRAGLKVFESVTLSGMIRMLHLRSTTFVQLCRLLPNVMMFCCHQSFRGACEWFEKVFGQVSYGQVGAGVA